MFRAICHPKTMLIRKESWGYTYSRRLGVVNVKSDSVISSTLKTKIEVYPNPAKNSLYVKSLKNQTSPLHYLISDINGKVVLKGASNTNNLGINIQSFNPVLIFSDYIMLTSSIFVQKKMMVN